MKFIKKEMLITSVLLVLFIASSSTSSTNVHGLIDDDSSVNEIDCSGSDSYFEDFTTDAYKDPSTTAWGWGTGTMTNTRDFSWELLDYYNTTFTARSVDVQGRRVYVGQFDAVSSVDAIGCYDINDPSNILLMSQRNSISRTLTFVVDGDVGYSGTDFASIAFNPYNISNPYALDAVSGVYLGGIARDGAVTDIDPEGYLVYYTVYNSVSDRSFRVINAEDPDNLVEIPASWISNKALGLEVEGHLAFIAASTDGLYILNVSSKYSHVEIGYLSLPGNATDVILDGHYAYVSCGEAGVALVDISNPELPELRAMYDTDGSAIRLVLQGNTLFVADGPGGVCVLDVASHYEISYVTKYNMPYVWDVDLYGGILVVASDEGIHTFRICAGDGITDFSESYYGNAWNGLQAWDVRVVGDIAYVAGGSDGFYTLDVSDPNNPILLDHKPLAVGSFRKLDVEGTFAHLITNDGYYIYNIQDPENILLEGYIAGNQLLDVFVQGDLVYLSWQMGGYGVINVTHPNLLSWINELDEPHYGTNVTSIWVQGPHVYTVEDNGGIAPSFYIHQSLDLTNQQITDSYPSTGYFYDIKVDGDLAFGADRNWLVVYDITDPYNVQFLKDIVVDSTYVRSNGIWNFGPYLLNAAGSDGVYLINAIDLNNSPATRYTAATGALQISTYGDYTYVANMSSLVILRHFESAGDTYIPGTVFAQSTNISSTADIVVKEATLTTDIFDHVSCSDDYYLSADGGLNWEAVTPNVLHVFIHTGGDLRWKVELTGLSDRSNHIFTINVDYDYDLITDESSIQLITSSLGLLFITILVTALYVPNKKQKLKE